MPAYACRDFDEGCDWFFRDGDSGTLMVQAVAHTEMEHESFMTDTFKVAIADLDKPFEKRTRFFGDIFDNWLKTVRWD